MDDNAKLLLQELHEHLRELHRKRDQIIAFFVAIAAALGAGWGHLGIYRGSVALAAAALGCFGYLALLSYGIWQLRYMGAITVLHHLWSHGTPVTLHSAEKAWALNTKFSRTEIVGMLVRHDPVIFVGYTALFGLGWHLALAANECCVSSPVRGRVFPALVNTLLVMALSNVIAFLSFRQARTAFPANEWMFRWLAEPPAGSGAPSPTGPCGLTKCR